MTTESRYTGTRKAHCATRMRVKVLCNRTRKENAGFERKQSVSGHKESILRRLLCRREKKHGYPGKRRISTAAVENDTQLTMTELPHLKSTGSTLHDD